MWIMAIWEYVCSKITQILVFTNMWIQSLYLWKESRADNRMCQYVFVFSHFIWPEQAFQNIYKLLWH